MARYRRIETGTWTDQKYVELSAPPPNGQTLWHYLLTGQRTTVFPGLVVAKEAVIAADLEWPIDGDGPSFRSVWAELDERDMAIPDWNTGVIVLPRALLDRRGEVKETARPTSSNAFRGWARQWDEVPDCSAKAWYLGELGRFAAALDRGRKDDDKPYTEAFEHAFATPIARVQYAYPDAFLTLTLTRSTRVQSDLFQQDNASRTRTSTRREPTRDPEIRERESIPLDRVPVFVVGPPSSPSSDPSGPRVERVLPLARGADWTAEKARLARALSALHAEIFNRVRIDIGADRKDKATYVPAMRPLGDAAERALLELLAQQVSFDGFEEHARHVLAVREEEATRTRSMKYLGTAVWRDGFGFATSMAVGERRGLHAAPSAFETLDELAAELRHTEGKAP